MNNPKSWSRGGCPRCETTIPLRMIVGGLGKPFPCRGCGAQLFSPKVKSGAAIGIGAVAAIFASKHYFGMPLFVVVLLVIGAAVAEFGFRKVYLVEE